MAQGPRQRRAHFVHALAAAGDHRHDRATETLGELAPVDRQAAALRQIDHVERDDDRQSVGEQFPDQHEIARQVARVDHDEHRIGLAVQAGAAQHVASDTRFGHLQAQLVQPGQVDDFGQPLAGQGSAPHA